MISPVRSLVRAALHNPPLAGLKPAGFSESAAQALLDHAPSLRLHRIINEMLSPGLAPDTAADVWAGLRRTCDLYEYLVLFRLADALSHRLGESWKWRVRHSPSLELLRHVPETGEIEIRNEELRIELRTQQDFLPTRSVELPEGFRSLSGKRSPDYVIGVFGPDETLKSWLVLDAKFRSNSTGVREGLGKIHIYRDGLRWNGIAPAAGYAIIPKTVESIKLYASTDYREHHNFGVLVCPMEPEEDWDIPIWSWLSREIGE